MQLLIIYRCTDEPTYEAAVADAQYELPYAMTIDATAVPQAPSAQSRRPLLKSALLQRQYESWGLSQPRVEYCASMLLKQVWPYAGRSDSPGTAVLRAVVVAGAVVDGAVDVEVVLGVEEDEAVVMAEEEDEVVELEEEPVAEELQFPYRGWLHGKSALRSVAAVELGSRRDGWMGRWRK